ncbi:patatin-like phospholipase family protein [Paenibacillus chitinolyticus]|uniref:patatin-like phospholipase family protein n=1 Tax=Paenibacillus chitinolyticus TaxID=79263 RepID=UPI0035D7B4BD
MNYFPLFIISPISFIMDIRVDNSLVKAVMVMSSDSSEDVHIKKPRKPLRIKTHIRHVNLSNNELSDILSTMEQKLGSGEKPKIGLALSGGGYRASFFHIGVLAELARAGILENINVISTVSGGSIVGAYYYLSLKRHAREKAVKGEVVNYNELIDEVAQQFYDRSRKNIRKKYYLRSLLRRNSSHNLAHLLDQFFYDDFAEGNYTHFTLGDLCSNNEGLPKLMVNTTNLNLGRLCCFSSELTDAHTNFYEIANQLTKHSPGGYRLDYKHITLGTVVAASSCVPGLFNPVTFDLGYSIQSFVDGGISDNSGIISLVNDNCNLIIVSDASLYMDYKNQPSSNPFGMALRTNDIFMDQLKRKTLKSLKGHNENLVYISIREELEEKTPRYENGVIPTTEYGVNYFVQHYLSRMRTDLNTFTEVEAKALMNDGMTICRHILEKQSPSKVVSKLKKEIPTAPDEESKYYYQFEDNRLKEELTNPSEKFLKVLNISNRRFMKTFSWRKDPYQLNEEPAKEGKGFPFLAFLSVSLMVSFIIYSMINEGIINASHDQFQQVLFIFVFRMIIYLLLPIHVLLLLIHAILFCLSGLQYIFFAQSILLPKGEESNTQDPNKGSVTNISG